jgi:hypothetical protein
VLVEITVAYHIFVTFVITLAVHVYFSSYLSNRQDGANISLKVILEKLQLRYKVQVPLPIQLRKLKSLKPRIILLP